MVKVYKGELSAVDLVEIGRTKGARTAVTPWGMDGVGLKRYVGAAVPWKLTKVPGAAGMSESDIEAIIGKFGALASGIKKIASVAKEVRGVTGAALGSISGTDYKGRAYFKRGYVPLRCLEIAKKHGKTVTVEKTAPRVSMIAVPYPEVIVPLPY